MPVISMFYGIIVQMYFVDDKQHHLPHPRQVPVPFRRAFD